MRFVKLNIVLGLLTLLGCAKQTAPTGGPKDETPPALVLSNPTNKTVNFNGQELELEFDELVQLNNPREQLIITPSINKKFEATVKKKKVSIKITEPLQENTTYTFNFREMVQDLNEKNPAANLKLALSTGSYIDSLYIKGIVKDHLKDLPLKEQTVALVQISDTTDIFKHPAQWLTITNEDGQFLLENLKAGSYLLYAFNDKNKNLIIDSKSEAYGVRTDTLHLTESLEDQTLTTIKLDIREFELISARPQATTFNIKFNKGIEGYTVTHEGNNRPVAHPVEANTTIKMYNNYLQLDSVLTHLIANDSIGNTIDTTFYAKFNKEQRRKEAAGSQLITSEYTTSNSTLKVKISFSKPIKNIDTDSIYIQLDSINRYNFTSESIALNPDSTELIIQETIQQSILFPTQEEPEQSTEITANTLQKGSAKSKTKSITLMLQKGTFITIEDDTLAPMNPTIRILRPEDAAIIHLKIQSGEDFIIQLLDPKYTVIHQILNQHEATFQNVLPGTYQIRLIIDKNKNGQWDPGNVYQRTNPEPVIYYSTEKGDRALNLKAFWELGPLLITYQ